MRLASVSGAALAVILASSGARADVPARVRLLVPTCADGLRWSALARALEVELHTLGSALATDGEADAQLILDVSCEEAPTEAAVTLVHVSSGRSHREILPLTDQGPAELALAMAELIRLRADALAREPPPPAPPVVDVGAFEAQVAAAVAAAMPEPEPEPPPRSPPAPLGALLDVTLGVDAYVAASNASAALRVGYSFGAPPFRLSIDVTTSVGWAGDTLGDVVFGGPGAGLGVRAAHREEHWAIASGLRLDLGWVRASGFSDAPGVDATEIDALHLAVVVDARLRLRVGADAWFLLIPELGTALVGIEVRAGGRRVTAQLGPRIGLSFGLSVAP